MKHRIGIYSGTFDPVHLGHLAFADEVQKVCRLDEVWFLPEQTPRNKVGVTGITDRVALLKLALSKNPAFTIVTLPSAQFTIQETLPKIQELTKNAELTMLLGSDVAQTLPSWPDIAMLLKNVSLAIGVRSETQIHDLEEALCQLPTVPTYTLIETVHAHITSSKIRLYHDSHQHHLHPATMTYIRKKSLYTTAKNSGLIHL
jgi:nicotinate (nicotinamide) nucleotide adenylyltransferase